MDGNTIEVIEKNEDASQEYHRINIQPAGRIKSNLIRIKS